jgi:hypothetical protein
VITDRELLRRAWPDGYLAMRGVLTVGGWTCCGVAPPDDGDGEERVAWWHAHGGKRPALRMAEGDLLPAVDPADTATWACLLRDLADAVWPGEAAPVDRIALRGSGSIWRVVASFAGARPGVLHGAEAHFGIEPTDDPALALVRIRAALRERA